MHASGGQRRPMVRRQARRAGRGPRLRPPADGRPCAAQGRREPHQCHLVEDPQAGPDHPAMAVRSWRDQGHLPVAGEPAASRTDGCRRRPSSARALRFAITGQMEGTFAHVAWNSLGNGQSVGIVHGFLFMILSIDLETRSPVDLKKSGLYRYFEHPWTEILCLAWAIDDGPIEGWTPGQPCPPPVWECVAGGGTISGWNVNFERQGWARRLTPKFGWPLPKLEQFQDTAAQAAAQSLPRSLERAASALRLPERKDMVGAKLMQLMAKPKRTWG